MLGSKVPTRFKDNKNILEQKHRMIKNHFICEFILEANDYQSIHEFIINTVETPYPTPHEDIMKITYPSVKSGSFSKASRKFGVSLGIINKAWSQCLRNEWRKHKAYMNDYQRNTDKTETTSDRLEFLKDCYVTNRWDSLDDLVEYLDIRLK